MKKILLSLATLFASFAVNAQALTNQSFDNLTVGNLSEDLTGATVGQGGWFVQTTGATKADFQIANIGTGDNALFLTTEAGVTAGGANVRYAVQKLGTSWANRTSGNDKIVCSYLFFTGTATANTNATLNARLYNSTGSTIVGFTYNNFTKIVKGQALLNTATVGSPGVYNVFLKNGTADLVLEDNTWYQFTLIFDKTTGDVYFVGNHPDFKTIRIPGGTTEGNSTASTGKDVGDFTIYSFTGAANATTGAPANAASQEFLIDEVFARAQADLSLSVKENAISSKFSVSPNPANNVINITNADNMLVNGVTVTDLNGRTVKNVSFEGVATAQVNVADLASGMYILNVTSDKGTATKKFVKN
jgi:hypothetical protein